MNKLLEKRIAELEKKIDLMSGQLNLALEYVPKDPSASLTKSRVILERLLLSIYSHEIKAEPKRKELGHILNDNQFTRRIERRILSRMQSVRDMGNLGSHGESVNSHDAIRVLIDLCDIIEWYCDKYAKILVIPNAEINANVEVITDEDLVNLGIQISTAISKDINQAEGSLEAGLTISEKKPGHLVQFIDILCNKTTRGIISSWSQRRNSKVALTGEDIPETNHDAFGPDIICSIDSLDGTQHWLRGRNLYSTAISFFKKDDNEPTKYKLRVSLVMTSDNAIYYAREDKKQAFKYGTPTALTIEGNVIHQISEAHVCTVARRPDHYKVLGRHISKGSPFAGLYTFGGNPILAGLSKGMYDAVFQPDASKIQDSQAVWDWLPGGHIAYRSNCTILELNGTEFDLIAKAEKSLNMPEQNCPYVTARSADLASNIVKWLNS